jgi:hypothetical protein
MPYRGRLPWYTGPQKDQLGGEKRWYWRKAGTRAIGRRLPRALGELADLILEKYGGDLNNLVKQNNWEPAKIREALKEIKGLGDVGVDIFFDTAQGVWPCLAPFVDPRSLKTAEQLGLGAVEELWHDVGEDPMEMCRLSTALTTVRLEKKEKEFMWTWSGEGELPYRWQHTMFVMMVK